MIKIDIAKTKIAMELVIKLDDGNILNKPIANPMDVKILKYNMNERSYLSCTSKVIKKQTTILAMKRMRFAVITHESSPSIGK